MNDASILIERRDGEVKIWSSSDGTRHSDINLIVEAMSENVEFDTAIRTAVSRLKKIELYGFGEIDPDDGIFLPNKYDDKKSKR